MGRLFFPGLATAAVLAAQLFRFPAPLRDAVTGAFAPGYALELPRAYLWASPFSAYADLLTFNSLRQHVALGAYLALGCLAWAARSRRGRGGWGSAAAGCALYWGVVALFLCWAVLAPRAAARLRLPSPELLALDLHSHTSHSWDGRRSFTPEANAAWHRDMGFDAAFITDHNTSAGAEEAKKRFRGGYRSLMGVELSLHDTHVAVLGNRYPIDNKPYSANLGGLRRFLGQCRSRYGGLPVLSLPEYWRHHWDRLELVAGWGAAGIEIVNASPKAMDFPAGKRREVLELARRRNLFVTGISDNHGWGRASYVWNVMLLPGHAAMSPEQLEAAVLEKLAREGFSALRVIVRARREPGPGPVLLFDPLLGIWDMLRSFTRAQAAVALAWLWTLSLAWGLLARGRAA